MSVDISRHAPPHNELCVHCVLWRKIDALVESYESKVQDFAAETLRANAWQQRAEKAEAERDRYRKALLWIVGHAHSHPWSVIMDVAGDALTEEES